MKSKYKSFLLKAISVWSLFVAFLFVSCNKDVVSSPGYDGDIFEQTALTKASDSDFKVYPPEVEWLVKNLYPELGDFEIDAYPDEENPLMYAVNFDEGWKIVSGDKRIDPILAFSNEGKMIINDSTNPGFNIWLEEVSKSILALDGIKDEYCKNLTFWKFEFPQKDDLQTKSGSGFWYRELVGEYVSGRYVNEIEPMLLTKWGQGYPWNQKAPRCYSSSANRCPLGCGPVAISQLLYYYHFHDAAPQGLFHTIIGHEYGYNGLGYALFSISRSDYTSPSNRWSLMPHDSTAASANLTYTQYVGDLIIDVGDRLGVTYSDFSTDLDPDTDLGSLFLDFDLISTSGEYNFNYVLNDLTNSRPVFIGGIPDNGAGHAWVIDGYRQDYLTTRRVYIWHEANSGWYGQTYTTSEAQAMLGPYYTLREGIGYQETTEGLGPKYFHMNWGWDGRDDGFYAFDASWLTYYTIKKIVYNIHATL